MIGLNPVPNCNLYVSVNDYDSDLVEINCGISQGSVLGPLFLLYINKFNQAIKLFTKEKRFTTLLMTLIYYVWVTISKKLNKLVMLA